MHHALCTVKLQLTCSGSPLTSLGLLNLLTAFARPLASLLLAATFADVSSSLFECACSSHSCCRSSRPVVALPAQLAAHALASLESSSLQSVNAVSSYSTSRQPVHPRAPPCHTRAHPARRPPAHTAFTCPPRHAAPSSSAAKALASTRRSCLSLSLATQFVKVNWLLRIWTHALALFSRLFFVACLT